MTSKELAAAQRLAIARLEISGSSNAPAKTEAEHFDDTSSQYGDRFKKAGNAMPKFHKLEFLIYDGKEDPLPWLTRVEQFLQGHGTIDDEKTWLASYHQTSWKLSGAVNLLWHDCTKALHKRFRPRIKQTHIWVA